MVAIPAAFSFFNLADGDTCDLNQVIFVEEEALRIRGPSSMFSTRQRFRAIIHVSAECSLHSKKALFDVTVIMDEILDPELDSITVPQNDPDPLRHPLPRGGSQHFGVAAELNRVIRLRRECQLRIPNLIFS